MGRLIIVAGVPGAGKSTLLRQAWKRVQRELKCTIVSFGTEMLKECAESGLAADRDEMRELAPDAQKEMQWRTARRVAERAETILLDTHCAIKTRSGTYLPGLTPRMLERLSPAAIILVEAHEAEIRRRRELDKKRPLRTLESPDDILEHTLVNRAYAAAFSAASGGLLRIIRNNPGASEPAVDAFIDTLRFIGVEAVASSGERHAVTIP
jgi:adenylate kinase